MFGVFFVLNCYIVNSVGVGLCFDAHTITKSFVPSAHESRALS